MCIGLPMTVIDSNDFSARCDRFGAIHPVSMLLVGAQPPGTRVLVHLGTAMRVLDPEEAARIDDALGGLAEAVAGRSFDHLFADLVDREPQLPDHLRDQ